jgi:formylglycine-generating enzyme required for sulfatase activity
MKNCLIVVLFSILNVMSQDVVRPQKFTATSMGGQVDRWDTKTSQWVTCDDKSHCEIGGLYATKTTSKVQLTFEPAIQLTIKENSRIKLDNLQVNESKKMIRMHIALEQGDFEIKTSGLQNSTLFLTFHTPVAVVMTNSCEASIHVTSDSTVLNVTAGELKAENRSSQIRAVVPEKYQASITGKTPDVVVSSVTEIEPIQKKSAKLPTIAILSVQANGVTKGNASNVANYVAEKYQEVSSDSKVLYLDDIREMLRVENGEGMLDCFTDSCITKIGALLGADLVIIGNLGQLGNNFLFSLKMVDVTRDKTLSRITKKVESDVGLILNEIPDMVTKLATAQNVLPVNDEVVQGAVTAGPGADAPFLEKEIWVNKGTFKMGLDFDGKTFDAIPMHSVILKGFYIDKYEVTREDFQKVMGSNPSSSKGCDRCPVENVTWDEADQYCKKIGKRLPTEAEWEYACRAGTTSKFHYGDVLSGDQANFDSKSPFGGVPASTPKNRVVPVGGYKPNAWGVHDMHGNVAEWCSDWYDAAYYGNSPVENPIGPKDGKLKVVRGGAWNGAATTLFSGKRFAYNPQIRLPSIGFRCVKDDYGNK